MKELSESELVLNGEGRVYHLNLSESDISDNIILVGDPGRVSLVSSFFDKITYEGGNRELFTKTGTFKGKPVSVISTGMGTDNIDIVINELDVLANIDLKTRKIKNESKSLNIIRIGTSGALKSDIDINSFVFSSHGIGMDGLLHYYKNSAAVRELDMEKIIVEKSSWLKEWPRPYVVKADEELLNRISSNYTKGMTLTASGFYGPQGRVLRLGLANEIFNEKIENFSCNGLAITNFEMETSALYGLGKMMGHKTLTACVIVANRINKTFSKDYHPAMKNLILHVLNNI